MLQTIELIIKLRVTSFNPTTLLENSFTIYADRILYFFTYLQWSKLQQQSQTMKNLQAGGVSLSHLQKFGNNEDILR